MRHAFRVTFGPMEPTSPGPSQLTVPTTVVLESKRALSAFGRCEAAIKNGMILRSVWRTAVLTPTETECLIATIYAQDGQTSILMETVRWIVVMGALMIPRRHPLCCAVAAYRKRIAMAMAYRIVTMCVRASTTTSTPITTARQMAAIIALTTPNATMDYSVMESRRVRMDRALWVRRRAPTDRHATSPVIHASASPAGSRPSAFPHRHLA